jgi:hypothetical protein
VPFAWHTDTLVRVRAPEVTNEYGDPERDWDAATSTPLAGWRVQPMQGSRVNVADTIPRDGLDKRRRAFGPYDADIQTTDRIEWDAATWTIEGDIDRWRSPTGALAHTEVILARMEG